MEESRVFNRTTIIISLVLTILATAGIVITPQNTILIIIGVAIVISGIILYEKFNQIEENTRNIKELNKILNIEKRFSNIEKELHEQRVKISMAVKK